MPGVSWSAKPESLWLLG